MKLTEEERIPNISFSSIEEGQYFLHEGKLYFRTFPLNNYALTVPDNKRISFDLYTKVFRVKITEIKYHIL